VALAGAATGELSGPIGSWFEFWFFVSRGGYAEVDASQTASWLDRLNYFRYQGGQLLVEFALVGTALAALGFWRSGSGGAGGWRRR